MIKTGDIVSAEGLMGTYEVAGFRDEVTALLKPLQHIVDDKTYYAKDIEKLTLIERARQ